MTMLVLVPDTQVRNLSDGALVNRLASDILHGLRSPGRTTLVAGARLGLDVGDPSDFIWGLTHEVPQRSSVVRHEDGSADVVLTPGIKVCVLPRGSAS